MTLRLIQESARKCNVSSSSRLTNQEMHNCIEGSAHTAAQDEKRNRPNFVDPPEADVNIENTFAGNDATWPKTKELLSLQL